MPKYRNKTIKFNMDNEKDRELWEYLQGMPYGLFSAGTKEMWEQTKSMRSVTEKYYKDEPEERTIMQRIERTEQNPESAKPWESVRRDHEQ